MKERKESTPRTGATGTPADAPLVALVGDDLFLRRQELEALLAAMRERQAVDVTRVEGDKADIADVLDEVRTYSMLGGKRVVVVQDADPLITKSRPILEKYAAAPAESGCLVLICQKKALPANSKLHKAVQKAGRVIPCEPLKGEKTLLAWLTRHARHAHGKSLDAQAAQLLLQGVGDDLGILDMELGKLSVYVEPRAKIGVEDVAALMGESREQTVFALVDAVVDGDARTALEQWRRVLQTDRAAEGRSVAGLAWKARQLLGARRAYDAGQPLANVARSIWIYEPRVLERRFERWTARRLERLLAGLLDIDVASKSGRGSVELGVEQWIVTHACSP